MRRAGGASSPDVAGAAGFLTEAAFFRPMGLLVATVGMRETTERCAKVTSLAAMGTDGVRREAERRKARRGGR